MEIREKQKIEIPVLGGRGGWSYKGRLLLTSEAIVFEGRTLVGGKKFTVSIPRKDIVGIRTVVHLLHLLPPHLDITYKDNKEKYPKMSLFEIERSTSYDPFFPMWKDKETRRAVFGPGWRFDREYIKTSFQYLKQIADQKEVTARIPSSYSSSNILRQSFIPLIFLPVYSITFFMGLVPALLLGANDFLAVMVGIIGGFVLAWIFCDSVFYSKLD